MAAFTNQARAAGCLRDRALDGHSGSLQLAQATLLDELPGLAIAIVTLTWIVTSFAQLA